MKIKGKTVLEYHIERLKWATLPIIVATTANSTDDPVVTLAQRLKALVFRGDEEDVLSRYFLAAKKYGLKTVIRVTSDCPLIDGNVIKQTLEKFTGCDYLSSTILPWIPVGMGFEIFTFSALKTAFENAVTSFEREHVTPYIINTHSHLFRIKSSLNNEENMAFRVTLDTQEDFNLIKELVEIYSCDKLAGAEIIEVLEKNLHLANTNTHM